MLAPQVLAPTVVLTPRVVLNMISAKRTLIRSISSAMFSATHEATTWLPASASARESQTLSERTSPSPIATE